MNVDFNSIISTFKKNKQETGYSCRRPHGYYWVKYKGFWRICYMCDVCVWTLMESSERILKLIDSDFDEIDERKIERNESS